MPEAVSRLSAPPRLRAIAGGLDRALMTAEGLSYEAGGRRLLSDVEIEIRPGRRTVVMGANGAGKSLLLRLMHGLIAPSAGQILWKGAPLSRSARRAQAMVFQRPVMLRRSVRANLRFALAVRGSARQERANRIEEALATAGLAALAARPARLLSGGEQQRLAIARALACAPELLFLDEPTASLDPAATKAVEDLIDTAHRAGVATVLVTHDAGQARRMGDDVIFMHGGRVTEAGLAAEVLTRPQSEPARAWLDGRLPLGPAMPARL